MPIHDTASNAARRIGRGMPSGHSLAFCSFCTSASTVLWSSSSSALRMASMSARCSVVSAASSASSSSKDGFSLLTTSSTGFFAAFAIRAARTRFRVALSCALASARRTTVGASEGPVSPPPAKWT